MYRRQMNSHFLSQYPCHIHLCELVSGGGWYLCPTTSTRKKCHFSLWSSIPVVITIYTATCNSSPFVQLASCLLLCLSIICTRPTKMLTCHCTDDDFSQWGRINSVMQRPRHQHCQCQEDVSEKCMKNTNMLIINATLRDTCRLLQKLINSLYVFSTKGNIPVLYKIKEHINAHTVSRNHTGN